MEPLSYHTNKTNISKPIKCVYSLPTLSFIYVQNSHKATVSN